MLLQDWSKNDAFKKRLNKLTGAILVLEKRIILPVLDNYKPGPKCWRRATSTTRRGITQFEASWFECRKCDNRVVASKSKGIWDCCKWYFGYKWGFNANKISFDVQSGDSIRDLTNIDVVLLFFICNGIKIYRGLSVLQKKSNLNEKWSAPRDLSFEQTELLKYSSVYCVNLQIDLWSDEAIPL